jgi:hypothetical protein
MRRPLARGSDSELSATEPGGRAAVVDSNNLCFQQRKSFIKPLRAARQGKISVVGRNPWTRGALTRKGVSSLGEFVSDASKRRSGTPCPRCQTSMREVTRIAPLLGEPGLIAYECPACDYLTSVIVPAEGETGHDAH